MGRIHLSIVIDAPRRAVWADVRDLASHVQWMADAEEITFTSRSCSGVGTTFDCLTKVGPFSLRDRMEVVHWNEGRAIGIRHVGLVTGEGRFTLRRARDGRTRFTWTERLRYPWWMGGPIGGIVADRVLAHLWRGNLRRLAARFDAPRD